MLAAWAKGGEKVPRIPGPPARTCLMSCLSRSAQSVSWSMMKPQPQGSRKLGSCQPVWVPGVPRPAGVMQISCSFSHDGQEISSRGSRGVEADASPSCVKRSGCCEVETRKKDSASGESANESGLPRSIAAF